MHRSSVHLSFAREKGLAMLRCLILAEGRVKASLLSLALVHNWDSYPVSSVNLFLMPSLAVNRKLEQ